MLRASSQVNEVETDLSSAVSATPGDSGVDCGEELLTYTDAVLEHRSQDAERMRMELMNKMGEAALVDAAAVIANFQRMVRIADSTGIPLDEPVLMISQDIRKDLGLNRFESFRNSPELSLGKRILGRLLGPFAHKLMVRMAEKRRA